jgi:threonine dehydrogenase-like Zn-dependent dehydrogenase
VAVFGCGPVGQFVITSAKLLGAGRIFAVDTVQSRLDMACEQGAEIVNFNKEHPVDAIHRLTGKIGVDRCIDAVGVDAFTAQKGPAAKEAAKKKSRFAEEISSIAPKTRPQGDNWIPGDAPSQVLAWAVDALAKAGTLSVIGVYPDEMRSFPLGSAMNKNLTVKMGNCNHRKYIPMLVDLVKNGTVDPSRVLTQRAPITSAIEAYKSFDKREEGWMKVELLPMETDARDIA